METKDKCWNCGAPQGDPPPEPPVGTWVRDRHGGVTLHQVQGGWAPPGCMPVARWAAMWEARGPLVPCGPWGADLAGSA